MSKKTLDELEQLQLKFLRSALAIGSGCPLPLLYSETGVICMELRILEKKLGFLHHLNQLPPGSLTKEELDIQISYGLPGIFKREVIHRYIPMNKKYLIGIYL